jgi:hypothetical protein
MRSIANGIVFALASAGAIAAHAQTPTTNNVRNTGTCNPVITGGSATVTIHCSGLSNEKATQMVELMNRILSQHLDLGEVNSKLDDLGSKVNDINTTLNPLSGAPIEVVKLYEEAQRLTPKCQNFAMDWSQSLARQSVPSPTTMSDPTSQGNKINEQKQDEYRRTLMPKIVSFNVDLTKAFGSHVLTDELIANPRSYVAVGNLGVRIRSFANMLDARAQATGQPVNASLLERAKAIEEECRTFSAGWKDAQFAVITKPTFISPLDASSEANKQRAALYRTSLGPELVSWKSRALPLVPNYTSTIDYASPGTSQDLLRVCTDIFMIEQAYQQKQQNQMLERRANGSNR